MEVKTTFDPVLNIISVHCLKGPQGGYLYVSQGYSKKGQAKKALKKIKKAGFENAKIVPMVF